MRFVGNSQTIHQKYAPNFDVIIPNKPGKNSLVRVLLSKRKVTFSHTKTLYNSIEIFTDFIPINSKIQYNKLEIQMIWKTNAHEKTNFQHQKWSNFAIGTICSDDFWSVAWMNVKHYESLLFCMLLKKKESQYTNTKPSRSAAFGARTQL